MANTIFGTSGKDEISGTRGPDRIDGLAGDDDIFGGRGDDYLIGGKGRDTLDGGVMKGQDRLQFLDLDTQADIKYVGANADASTLAQGEITSTYDAAKKQTMVLVGYDKNAGADMQVALDGQIDLAQADFLNQF